ncbi:hypothetical protein [Cystobacter fuscus]|uniref:hypothetical protein n=1 Tax=Cystobacter fuscus TaxID=43 RepID=UPI002B2C4A45|nr:hypothetical protein F0U63_22885 [Cystobacter fuscus]
MSKKLFVCSVGLVMSACQEAPLAHEPQANTRLGQALTAQGTTVQGTFYDFEVVGMTGNGQVHAATTYPVIGNGPSINDQGRVAFVASKLHDGESIFRDNGSTPLNLTGSPYTVYESPRINTAGHVAAIEETLGWMGLRVWTGPDTSTVITYGDGSSGFYPLGPSVALNDSGQTAFIANSVASHTPVVATRNASANAPFYTRQTFAWVDAIAMDNAGNVVYVHNTGVDEDPRILVLAPNDLSSATRIADATCFSSIGDAAGISPDGRIIVFYGESNGACAIQPQAESAEGVFASLDIGGPTRKLVRLSGVKVEAQGNGDGTCDVGETCRSGELGFDQQGNPFSFASYITGSRIGVAHQQLGAAGLADDSFVVSIVGTPNAAHHQGRFSAQQGIWTVRADVSAGSAFKLNLSTPIPVVQIGDSIGSEVVASFGSPYYVNPDIANARVAYSGAPRQQARGDHRVVFYAKTTTGQELVVRSEHLE